ncbi:hypothetical protein J7K41_03940 [Candidatus Micrarchaeota archaeon]|nr:hypothetical protein [Candidatus Micrarchaeota archaeon]
MGYIQKQTDGYRIALDKISEDLSNKLWEFFINKFKGEPWYESIVSEWEDGKIVIVSSDEIEEKCNLKSMIDYDYYSKVMKSDADIIFLDKNGFKKFIQTWLEENIPRDKINDDKFVQEQVTKLLKDLGYEEHEKVQRILKMVPKKVDEAYSEAYSNVYTETTATPGTDTTRISVSGGINSKGSLHGKIGYGPLSLQVSGAQKLDYILAGLSLIPELGISADAYLYPHPDLTLSFYYARYSLAQKKWEPFVVSGYDILIRFIQNVTLGKGNFLNRFRHGAKETYLQTIYPIANLGRYLHTGVTKFLSLFGWKYEYNTVEEVVETIDTTRKIISDPEGVAVAMHYPSLYIPEFENAVLSKTGYLSGVGMAMLDNLKLFDAQGKYMVFTWPPFQNKVKYERKQIRKRIEKAMEYNEKIVEKIENGEDLSENELNQFKANLVYLGLKLLGQSDCPYERENIEKNIKKSWDALRSYLKMKKLKYDNNVSMYMDGLFFNFIGQLMKDKEAFITGYQLMMYALIKEAEKIEKEGPMITSGNRVIEESEVVMDLFKMYSEIARRCDYIELCINSAFELTEYLDKKFFPEDLRATVENKIRRFVKELPIKEWRNELIKNSTKKGFANEQKAYESFGYLVTVKMILGALDEETTEVLLFYSKYLTKVNEIQTSISLVDTSLVRSILDECSKFPQKEQTAILENLQNSIDLTITCAEAVLEWIDKEKPETESGKRFLQRLKKKYERMLPRLEKAKKDVEEKIKEMSKKAS